VKAQPSQRVNSSQPSRRRVASVWWGLVDLIAETEVGMGGKT
jgi:hypothetical protein